jgi:hypothetical protein
VTINVTALAASAATLLVAAAKRVVAKPAALFMTHSASAMTLGDSEAHRATAAVLDKINAEVVDLYFAAMSRRRPGTRPSDAAKLVESETWFSGDQAQAAGLIDHAEPASAGASPRASLNFKIDVRGLYRNPPEALFALMALESQMPEPVIDPANPVNPAVADANAVTLDILNRCAAAGLSAVQTNEIVLKAKGDINIARDAITAALIARDPSRSEPYRPAHVSLDDPRALHAAVRDTLIARMSGRPPAKDSPASALMGKSVLDLGVMVLEANGGKVRSWSKDRLAAEIFSPTMSGGRFSTSDFPALTTEAGQRILLDAYEAGASPLKTIARRRSATDFRSIATIRLGEPPQLLEIPEGGEVTFGGRAESVESFKLRTFGRIFSLTREAIISDDLGGFADAARAWGTAAASVEANELYALIADDGVVLEDNVSLWNAATHGNLAGEAAALDVDGLSDARKALRDTKGLDGVTPLNLAPRFLLVGSANETQGEKVLATLAAATVDEANPFSGRLTLLVEPRIADYAWFVFADPLQAEVLSYANLGDATGPQLATRDGFTTLGTEYRAIHDFGAGATGYRGAFKNSGSAPS